MLVGFGSDMVEIKPNGNGKYFARRWRPYQSAPIGPFKTFDEALKASKEIPKEPPETPNNS